MSGQPPVVVRVASGKIADIRSLNDGTRLQQYVLEPPLITGVSEKSREKRRLVRFRDIPPSLVHAVISWKISASSSTAASIPSAL